jgi:hypothetical protein
VTFTNGFDFLNRRLRLQALLDYRGGYKAYNNTERIRCASRQNCNGMMNPKATLEEQAMAVAHLNHPAKTLDGFFQDGTFLKLREVTLRYSLDPRFASLLRARNADVIVTGRNLGTWTKYRGLDPENDYLVTSTTTRDAPSRFRDGWPGDVLHHPPQPRFLTPNESNRPMIKHFKSIGRLRASVGTLAMATFPFVGGLAACNSKETLLEAVDPDVIDPNDINSSEGALALYVGALGRLRQATGGSSVATGGEGSSWLFGGLLADEWSTSSTFVRTTRPMSARFRRATRRSKACSATSPAHVATQAIRVMKEFRDTEVAKIAEPILRVRSPRCMANDSATGSVERCGK